MVEKAHPGTISSVILSIVVVGLLLMPFYMANQRDKVRIGEGEYEFKEVICFDINSEDQFWNEADYVHNSFSGAFLWRYRYYPDANRWVHQNVQITNLPLEETVDGQASAITQMYGSDVQRYNPLGTPFVTFLFSFYKEEIIDLDVTRMDIYLDINNAPFDEIYCYLSSQYWNSELPFGKITLGELTSISISVDDLLTINSIPDDRRIGVFFIMEDIASSSILMPENELVVFDMQWYHIEEFKISSIDYMGIAMLGGGIFMTFCSILMLPNVTFRSIIGGMAGKGS